MPSRWPVAALLLAGVLWAPPRGATAEAPWEPAAVRHQREARHARALAARLKALEGVMEAQVLVRLPAPLEAPLDAPAPLPRVQIALRPTPGAARADQEALATGLAVSEVEGARPAHVHVRWLTAEPQAPAPLVRVGPFHVASASAGWLRATLLALLAIGFVLAALLLGYVRLAGGHRRGS